MVMIAFVRNVVVVLIVFPLVVFLAVLNVEFPQEPSKLCALAQRVRAIQRQRVIDVGSRDDLDKA